MQRYIVDQNFGLENLRLQSKVADLTPKPGEVLLKMQFASLNYRDLLMLEGQYNPKLKLPYVPLSDGVGVVAEVGEGVSSFKIGDVVLPLFAQNWFYGDPPSDVFRFTLGGPLNGTLTQQMCVPKESLVKVPASLSQQEAATLPCAALTAFSALFTYGHLQPKDKVLVMGTGGVSIFALQFAKATGAKVAALSSQPEKLEFLSRLGADFTLNYRETPEWGKRIRKEFGAVDYVVEVGGANTLAQSLQCLRNGGTILLIGILSGSEKPLNLLPILMRNIRVQGILVGSKFSMEAMLSFLENTQVKPVVDRVFGWREASEAFLYLKQQKHVGKVLVRIEDHGF